VAQDQAPEPQICHACGYRPPEGAGRTTCPDDGSTLVPESEHDKAPDDPFLGRTIAGKYPIVGIVGAGGMGAVYRAIQQPVGREVALKVVRNTGGDRPSVQRRFEKEAEVVARLEHPNTVTLHAARASSVTPFYAGGFREGEEPDGCGPVAALDGAGWYCGNADGTSHIAADVESLPSVCNAWGLCDVLGNVSEWVWDLYHDTYGAPEGPRGAVDPTGPGDGERRVFRGGSWAIQARYLRSAARNHRQPDSRGQDTGFRPVRFVLP